MAEDAAADSAAAAAAAASEPPPFVPPAAQKRAARRLRAACGCKDDGTLLEKIETATMLGHACSSRILRFAKLHLASII